MALGLAALKATLTIQHPSNEALALQVQNLKKVWQYFTDKGLRARKIHFYGAIIEFGATGSNAHIHFIATHSRDHDSLASWMQFRWKQGCSLLGRRCEQLRIENIESPEAAAHFIRYITKRSKAEEILSWPVERQLQRLELPDRWKGYFHSRRVVHQSKAGSDWLPMSLVDQILAGCCEDQTAIERLVSEHETIAHAFRRVDDLQLAQRIDEYAKYMLSRQSTVSATTH